jgi:hypothetical protein
VQLAAVVSRGATAVSSWGLHCVTNTAVQLATAASISPGLVVMVEVQRAATSDAAAGVCTG